jgi:small subunit ribosomal protein S11
MAVKKIRRNVLKGVVHVKSTFNNTIISVTDIDGDVLAWDSSGALGFKGSRKSTPFAAQKAAENVAKKVVKLGMKEVDVFIKGPGAGRESSVRALEASGLKVKMILDVTPIPHNGCRPPKKRRV